MQWCVTDCGGVLTETPSNPLVFLYPFTRVCVCVCKTKDYNHHHHHHHQKCAQQLIISSLPVNGLGQPGVLPPYALGLGGTPLPAGYGGGLPSLGAFALTATGAMNSTAQALRGISNVLLVSNLNEEVTELNHLNPLCPCSSTLFCFLCRCSTPQIIWNRCHSWPIPMSFLWIESHSTDCDYE